jgi:hypothetical protein
MSVGKVVTSIKPVLESTGNSNYAPESLDGLSITMGYTLTNSKMSTSYSSDVTFTATDVTNEYEMTGFLANGVFDESVRVLPLKVEFKPDEGRLLIPCGQVNVIYMGYQFTLYNIHEGDEALTTVPLVFEFNEKGGLDWVQTITVTDENNQVSNYTCDSAYLACFDIFQWLYRIGSPFFVKTNGKFTATLEVDSSQRETSQSVVAEYADNVLSVANWIGSDFQNKVILAVDGEKNTVKATDAYMAENVRLANCLGSSMANVGEYILTGNYIVENGRTNIEFSQWSAFDSDGVIVYYPVIKSTLSLDFELPYTNGVEGIESDNIDCEYFTISGIKVNKPEEGGLYIRKQGTKTEKIIVK